jgi:hypothetical protein
MPFPRDEPISGSFLAPNSSKTTIKMKIISHIPKLPKPISQVLQRVRDPRFSSMQPTPRFV